MISELLRQRALPPLLTLRDGTPVTDPAQLPARRAELLDILSAHCYGRSPAPVPVTGTVEEEEDRYCAGKVLRQSVRLTLTTPNGPWSFPLQLFLPKNRPDAPLFLHIAFRPEYPDRYYPVEEITDNGFATAMFCYQDVTSDDGDFQNSLAGLYVGDRYRRADEWGKIGMWAWAASRALDWLLTREGFDHSRVFVTGHSRLGKTALWCAAQDERFCMGVSNDSGCGGAALERGKNGEHVREITGRFPYWFCPAYRNYAENVRELPFDHHFLRAAAAPRAVYVASAAEDTWADPASEFLSCAAASPAWELFGLPGLVCGEDGLPAAPAQLHGGRVAYHLRPGTHYYGREDWLRQMVYAKTL